ncbi:MAG: alpha/beta hydrolase [Isosphaeraceae bacterium]|nr:alpha/beta hydrolase [Isosphaeraceae bacterium]
MSGHYHEGKEHQVRLQREWVDVVEMGRGEPIVLVPGLAGSWKLLGPLAHVLARKHTVYACGMRGDRFPLGLSLPRDIGEQAQDLHDLIDQLGLERPAVMGVSFGGAVALEFAVEHPQRLGALVVAGAEARFRASLGSTIARRVLERFPLPCDNGFVNQFFNLLHGGKPEPGPLADFVVERCWETDQSVLAHRLGMLDSFDVADRLWRIDVPTLVLAGSRDVVVPPARQRALADAIGSAQFETLEGAGHIGFLTHRLDVARRVGHLLHAARHTHCE